jgi:short-subunit dehydrogenase
MAPTLLDEELERHEGVEPRVITADVQAILRRKVRPGEDDGESVRVLANNAGYSTRTVYRVLKGETQTIALDLADKLCIAAGSHLAECRLVLGDGQIISYN